MNNNNNTNADEDPDPGSSSTSSSTAPAPTPSSSSTPTPSQQPLLTPSGRPQRSTRSSVSYNTSSRASTSSNNPYKRPTYSIGGGRRKSSNGNFEDEDEPTHPVSTTPRGTRGKKRGKGNRNSTKTVEPITITTTTNKGGGRSRSARGVAVSSAVSTPKSTPTITHHGRKTVVPQSRRRRPECVQGRRSSRGGGGQQPQPTPGSSTSTKPSRSSKRKKLKDRDYGSDFDSEEEDEEDEVDYEEEDNEDEENDEDVEDDIEDDMEIDLSISDLDILSPVSTLPIWLDGSLDLPPLVLPSCSEDLLISQNLVLAAATVYEPVRRFSNLIRLTPFRFEDFCRAVELEGEQSPLIVEVHVQLLKTLLRSDDSSSFTFSSTECKDSASAALFFIDSMTWVEVLRSYLESDPEWAETLSTLTSVDYPFCGAGVRLEILNWMVDQLLGSNCVRELLGSDGKIGHEDHCRYCNRLGELICCETCPAVYHLGCIGVGTFDENEGPPDDWKCPICIKHQLAGVSDCVSEVERAGCLYRHESLGVDRHGRKYWWVGRRVVVEPPPTPTPSDSPSPSAPSANLSSSEFYYYSTKYQFLELLHRLDGSNYEKVLVSKLEELRDEILGQMEITEQITKSQMMEQKLGSGTIISKCNKSWIESENEFLKSLIEEREKKKSVDKGHSPGESESADLTPSMEIVEEESFRPLTRSSTSATTQLYKLGSENSHKNYVNLYTCDPLALSKTQHSDERDRRRLMSHKFSLTTASECKWGGSQYGSKAALLNTLRTTVLQFESSIPSTLMHVDWGGMRKNWINCVNSGQLGEALMRLSLCLRGCVFNPIWGEGVGHVKLYRVSSGEKERRKKYELKVKKFKEEEEEKLKNLKQFIKYSIPPKHTVFKMKGEEYRVHGNWGWIWGRRGRRSRFIDCRKLGLLGGPEKFVIQVKSGGKEGKVKTMMIDPEVYNRLMEKRSGGGASLGGGAGASGGAEKESKTVQDENVGGASIKTEPLEELEPGASVVSIKTEPPEEEYSTCSTVLTCIIDEIIKLEKVVPPEKENLNLPPSIPLKKFRSDLLNISLGIVSANRILYPRIAHRAKTLDSFLPRRLDLINQEEENIKNEFSEVKLSTLKTLPEKLEKLESLKTAKINLDSSFPLAGGYAYTCYSNLCSLESLKNENFEKVCYSPMCRLKFVISESRRRKNLKELEREIEEIRNLEKEIEKRRVYSKADLNSSGKIYLKKNLLKVNDLEKRILCPQSSKFRTRSTKLESILILPQHDLRKLARSGGVGFTPPGYSNINNNNKAMSWTWPYPCGRPLYKTTWQFRTRVGLGDGQEEGQQGEGHGPGQNLRISATAMQLRLLYASIRWDDIQMKPPTTSDGKSQIQTDMEIITTEILDHRITGRFNEIVQYLRRRHIVPIDAPKTIREVTPSRSGLRKRKIRAESPDNSSPQVVEEWVGEDLFEVWEIRYYGDRSERKKLEPPPSSSTRTKSGIMLKQPEKWDPSPKEKEKDKELSSPAKKQNLEALFPLEKKVELVSKREKKNVQVYGKSTTNSTTTTTTSATTTNLTTTNSTTPQTASQQLAAAKTNSKLKNNNSSAATPTPPGQRLQVFKGPDGRLQVKGLLPNQSCYQTGDGKIHVVTNPINNQKQQPQPHQQQPQNLNNIQSNVAVPIKEVKEVPTATGITTTTPQQQQPRQYSPAAVAVASASPNVVNPITQINQLQPHITPEPRKSTTTSSILRGQTPKQQKVQKPQQQQPQPTPATTSTSSNTITAVRGPDGRIHIRGIPPGQKAIQAADGTIHILPITPAPVSIPAPPIAAPSPAPTTQTITATRTPEGHVEVKGLLPGQNATQDPDGNILITAPIQPGETSGRILAKINVSNLQVPSAESPVVSPQKPPQQPPQPPAPAAESSAQQSQLLGTSGTITATRTPDGRIEVHGLGPDQTAVQLPDGRIQIITNSTTKDVAQQPQPQQQPIPKPQPKQPQIQPQQPQPPTNNIIARKLPNGSYEFEGLLPGQHALQLPDGRFCIVNSNPNATTTQQQPQPQQTTTQQQQPQPQTKPIANILNRSTTSSSSSSPQLTAPQHQQQPQQQQPLPTTPPQQPQQPPPPPSKIRIQTPKGILEIDSRCLITNPITGQHQIVLQSNTTKLPQTKQPQQQQNQQPQNLPISIVSPTKQRAAAMISLQQNINANVVKNQQPHQQPQPQQQPQQVKKLEAKSQPQSTLPTTTPAAAAPHQQPHHQLPPQLPHQNVPRQSLGKFSPLPISQPFATKSAPPPPPPPLKTPSQKSPPKKRPPSPNKKPPIPPKSPKLSIDPLTPKLQIVSPTKLVEVVDDPVIDLKTEPEEEISTKLKPSRRKSPVRSPVPQPSISQKKSIEKQNEEQAVIPPMSPPKFIDLDLLASRRELLKKDMIAKRTILEREILREVRKEIEENLMMGGRMERGGKGGGGFKKKKGGKTTKIKNTSSVLVDGQNQQQGHEKGGQMKGKGKGKKKKKGEEMKGGSVLKNKQKLGGILLRTEKSKPMIGSGVVLAPATPTTHLPKKQQTPSSFCIGVAGPSSSISSTTHPLKKSPPTHSYPPSEKLFCTCSTPYDPSKFMIACDSCDNWFHAECIQMPVSKCKALKEYICENCKKPAPSSSQKQFQKQSQPQKQLYCLCKSAYDDSQFYISCDSCLDWFHGRCVGILQTEGENLKTYNCPKCDPELEINRINRKLLETKDFELLLKLIKQIKMHKSSWAFREAVDKSEAPNYYKVIKEPMDLSLMEIRLSSRVYSRLSDFIGDMMRIFENCRYYNTPDSTFVKSADQLENWFGSKIKLVREKMGESKA